MLDLIPLAIGSAIYPTLITLVILILGRPQPARLLAAYLSGALLISIASGLAIVAALNAGNVVGGSDHTVSPAVDITVGLIALLLLYLLLTNRDRRLRERLASRRRRREAEERKSPWSHRVLERDSIAFTFLLAMALDLPGALYLVALKDVAAADQPTSAQVAEVLAFNLIMYVSAEVPLISYALAPDRTREVVASANEWLGSNARRIAIVLCAAAGALLLLRGLVRATG